MRVLLACEESQAVCIEFRKLGIEAFSCDIEDCTGNHPEWHIKDDVLNVIKQGWDLMIAFPPCTHLAVSGAKHFEQKIKDGRQQQAIDFFMKIVNAPINKIAIENPIGIMSNLYRKPDQIIQPYYFGDEAQKTTCLWFKNMPKLYHNEKPNLFDDNITHVGKGEFLTFSSGKRMPKWYSNGDGNKRSKTFKGIAKAMATQWSKL
jgi:site-specific DNA-cytosine methylase